MEEVKRIYILLSHRDGLKIKDIAKELDLDKFYVADVMYSTDNIPYWYQNDGSLWFAKEGVIEIEEKPEEEKDELIAPVEIPQRFNINRFLRIDISDSLRAYLYQIPKYRIYSNDEILLLLKRYRNGDKKAFELIVKSQQRFVANIAYLYCRKGASLEDIIQEGNIGLIKAIERFDETQCRSFSSFAKSWILQAISISMTTIPFMVRLPLNIIYQYRKIRKFKEKFEQKNEIPPSVIDIETDEDLDFDKISFLDQYPDSLIELVEFTDNLDYLESDSNLATFYEDNEYNSYLVQKLIKRLKKNESRILRHYYGIGVVEETLSSIGDEMNLSRERVRQILWSTIHSLKDIFKINRVEAKKGDKIRVDSSHHLGHVIDIKKDETGSTILVVKMDSGDTKELSVYDTPYQIIKKTTKHKIKSAPKTPQNNPFNTNNNLSKKEEENTILDPRVEITEVEDIRISDKILYNSLSCIVRKIVVYGDSTKLVIEYDDGVQDLVPYNKAKIKKCPSATHPTKIISCEKSREMQKFPSYTSLQRLVDLRIISRKEQSHCYKRKLRTIADVIEIIKRYNLTPYSTRFTKYTLDIWFNIANLSDTNLVSIAHKEPKKSENVIEKKEKVIDVKKLNMLFDNKTTSYKYFWFLAIISLAKENNSLSMTYKDILIRMVAIAWAIVMKHKINLGKQDMLSRYLLEIAEKSSLNRNSSARYVEYYLHEYYVELEIKRILSPLLINVPYRFLSPWVKFTSNKEVSDISRMNSFDGLYAINTHGIILNTKWWKYIKSHYSVICLSSIDAFNQYAINNNDKDLERKLENIDWNVILRQ